jgi:hypothetical protein
LCCVAALALLPLGCDESGKPPQQDSSDQTEADNEVAFCGNGIPEAGEACDHGVFNGSYGMCRQDCSGTRGCGDGIVDDDEEECDDGEQNGSYGFCRSDCSGVSRCGDALIDAPEELCDHGVLNGGYGRCADDCQSVVGCGDGELDASYESCDDGSSNGIYGKCREDCTGIANCGDGLVDESYERCDDGADNGQYGRCSTRCERPPFPFPNRASELDPSWVDTPPPCSEHDWFVKYLHYRQRFRGNASAAQPGFIVIGEGPGFSIPASRREPHLDCAGHWSMTECPREDLADARGRYNWGDATIWLGMYLEVLATEYAMFTQLGLDTQETLNDLYLALEAFNRVDEAAELVFDETPARDGFYLRDDVPADLHLLPDGGYRFPRDDGDNLGYECVNSTASCEALTPDSIDHGAFTSQDQMIGMIHGLALVAALVPEQVQVQGVALGDQAREMVHRQVKHLRDHSWRITSPWGTHPPDAWGGNALGFSNLFAGAANVVCGQDYGLEDYHDDVSTSGVALAAITLLDTGWFSTHNYNRTMALRLMAITGTWDRDGKFAQRAIGDGKDFFVLSRYLLGELPLPEDFPYWRIEAVLDSAPCSGPCFATTNCSNPMGWSGENGITTPGDRFGNRHFTGEYNGLDYMALHNAYFLARGGRVGQQLPEPEQLNCENFRGIDILSTEVSLSGEEYDHLDPCAAAELHRVYCGRSLADWIDAAYRGEAQIFTGRSRWGCIGQELCWLNPWSEIGSDGNDLIIGTPGDDNIHGGAGHDCIVGLEGDDFLRGGAGHDMLLGGPGADRLVGDDENEEGIDWLYGGDGDDEIYGNLGADELHGGDGNDVIEAHEGNDLIDAGDGDDVIRAGEGHDAVQAGGGNDTVYADSGDDSVWCGDGRDKVRGGAGDDWLWGEGDDDLLWGENGDDVLYTGEGLDHVCAGNDDDTIWANWDGDLCDGGSGNNSVNGCAGGLTEDECSAAAFEAW